MNEIQCLWVLDFDEALFCHFIVIINVYKDTFPQVFMVNEKENIVSIKIYESDRNWMERIKRKFRKDNFAIIFKSMRDLIRKYKLEGELE